MGGAPRTGGAIYPLRQGGGKCPAADAVHRCSKCACPPGDRCL